MAHTLNTINTINTITINTTPLATVVRPTTRIIRVSPKYYQGLENHPDREAILAKVKEESLQYQQSRLKGFTFTQEGGETVVSYRDWRNGEYVRCTRTWKGGGIKTARKAAKALAFGGILPPEVNTKQTLPVSRPGWRPTGWERS